MKFKKPKHFTEIIITCIYFVIIGLYTDFTFDKFKELAPNELGDFLAGAFAPLVFMWLTFGYFQQGKELQQQAEELRQSVEQQRELVEVTRQQYLHQKLINHRNAQPKLSISISFVSQSYGCDVQGNQHNQYNVKVAIKNTGSPITRAKVIFENGGWSCDDELIGNISDEIKETYFSGDMSLISSVTPFDIVFLDGLMEHSKFSFILEYYADYAGDEKYKFKITEDLMTV